MKVHPIAHAIFETARSGFIQILNHCSLSWKITPLYFLAQRSYTLDKNSPLKLKFLDFWVVRWKLTKFPMSCLKLQVSFSLNFASLFRVMRDNFSVLFLAETLYYFDESAKNYLERIKVPNFRHSISPNLYIDRLILLKAYKISAKKVQRSCVSWHWRFMQNLNKNWFVVFGEFWSEHSKVSKICILIGPFR